MKTALVGHTGFVGSNLLSQSPFTHLYHSRNSADLEGENFDLLVCAGAKAEKWKANQDPAGDADHIHSLIHTLSKSKASEAILISTVDVFPEPVFVDEASEIDVLKQNTYGKHRYELEQFFRSHFPVSLIVRLPALFGKGMKKNAIYDLLHDNQVEKIHPQSRFQFYNLENIWSDIQIARGNGLKLVHFAVEPSSMRAVASDGLGIKLESVPTTEPALYDFRSRFCALWNHTDGYLYSADQTVAALQTFKKRHAGEK
jgi:hypothetical protein